jgi:predicted RNase H-like nuclease (RuvC/YqgF family)
MMKISDKAMEKSAIDSTDVKSTSENIIELAKTVARLALSMRNLAGIISDQKKKIEQLQQEVSDLTIIQAHLLQSLKENTVDLMLPEIKQKDKPN